MAKQVEPLSRAVANQGDFFTLNHLQGEGAARKWLFLRPGLRLERFFYIFVLLARDHTRGKCDHPSCRQRKNTKMQTIHGDIAQSQAGC